MPVDIDKATEVWQRYRWVRDNGHRDFMQKARKCEDFFAGVQWNPADLVSLNEQRRPALTINKIISTISNVLGQQIFNRTETTFKPSNGDATREIATALTKIFMQISDNNQLPWVRSDVFADGIVTSRGFYDVRLDFTDSLRGEVRITQLNPKQVMIDPDADSYDPSSWGDVLHTKWLTCDQIELLYGKADADILRVSAGDLSYLSRDNEDQDRFAPTHGLMATAISGDPIPVARNVRVVERQHKRLCRTLHFVDKITGDMRMVPDELSKNDALLFEYMMKNPHLHLTKKIIERIRWTVIADNLVLHDDWSPYQFFTVIPFFPMFQRGRTIGLVENLLGPQELLNKVSSQELHVVNTTANSGWKIKQGALVNMSVGELETRGATTGLVLELNDIEGAEKIQPNQTPQGLDRISFKAEDHIKTISGVSDYSQGFAREDVAAKSVVANQQAGSTNLAKVIDNLRRTDWLLAQAVLSCVQTYYTEERLYYITHDRFTQDTEELRVNQITPEGRIVNDLTIGEYAVVITSQPERDTFEDTQFEQAVRLRTDVGIQIPDSVIIKASNLADKAEILTAMEGDKTSPQAQAAAQFDQRVKEADVAKTEAETKNKEADAQLKTARTGKEQVDTQKEASTPPNNEMVLKQQQMQQEFQLKKEAQDKEFDLKRDMMNREMALKEDTARKEASIKRVANLQSTLQKTT